MNTATIDSKILLEELEESIPQGVPNATRVEADDGFAELDALLDQSMTDIREKAQHEADLKARKRNFVGMSRDEVEFCNSRMAAFELARIWEVDSAISIWARYTCTNCDSKRTVFSRYMEHQQSRHNASTHRWITVKSTNYEAMPVREEREVPTCPRCSEWELDPRLMTDLKELLG